MKVPPFLKKKRILAGIVLLLFCAGAALWFFRSSSAKDALESESSSPDRIYTVKKGDLVLGVMLTGSVNAKTKYKLAMEAPWGTKLIRVVDENKEVKKGECVAEYET